MIFARLLMRKQFFSPIRYFIVRSVKRLVGELTVSTLATLIVTAILSNLFLVSRTVPSAPTAYRNADAIIFSPRPIGPGNNGLEAVNVVVEPVALGRDKAAREQSARKIPRPPARIVEPAPIAPAVPLVQPPLQLSGASIAAATPTIEPNEKSAAVGSLTQSEPFRPASLVMRPIHAFVGQLTWLMPRF
jgi:hypothetical protein